MTEKQAVELIKQLTRVANALEKQTSLPAIVNYGYPSEAVARWQGGDRQS